MMVDNLSECHSLMPHYVLDAEQGLLDGAGLVVFVLVAMPSI